MAGAAARVGDSRGRRAPGWEAEVRHDDTQGVVARKGRLTVSARTPMTATPVKQSRSALSVGAMCIAEAGWTV